MLYRGRSEINPTQIVFAQILMGIAAFIHYTTAVVLIACIGFSVCVVLVALNTHSCAQAAVRSAKMATGFDLLTPSQPSLGRDIASVFVCVCDDACFYVCHCE